MCEVFQGLVEESECYCAGSLQFGWKEKKSRPLSSANPLTTSSSCDSKKEVIFLHRDGM